MGMFITPRRVCSFAMCETNQPRCVAPGCIDGAVYEVLMEGERIPLCIRHTEDTDWKRPVGASDR